MHIICRQLFTVDQMAQLATSKWSNKFVESIESCGICKQKSNTKHIIKKVDPFKFKVSIVFTANSKKVVLCKP